MSRVLALALGIALLAPACKTPLPAKRASVRKIEPREPAEFLPNDLDFVVRIDAARLRKEPAIDEAARGFAKAGGSNMLRAIVPSLARSRAIFVGARFMPDGFHGDGVVAIDRSPPDEPNEQGPLDASFHRIEPSGVGFAIFERATDARDEAALEVELEKGGIVLATLAEADAVLRVARLGSDADRLDPPARGLASFVGKSSGPPAGAAILERMARGLQRYTGVVEGGDAIHLEAELVYTTAEAAAEAASVARSILARLADSTGPLRSLSDSVKLANEAEVVRLRAAVPFALIANAH